MSNRFGRFNIPGDYVYDFPEAMLAVMSNCIIVRAEHNFASGMIEYTAVSEQFSEHEDGEEIPLYYWIATTEVDENGIDRVSKVVAEKTREDGPNRRVARGHIVL